MPHVSYPTPSNLEMDIGDDHLSPVLKVHNLQRLDAEDFMAVREIAKFWAIHHGRASINANWKPAYLRVEAELHRRLEAGKVR